MIFGKEQKEKNRRPPIRTKQKVRANMNKLKYSVLMSVYAKESAQNLRQAMESMLRQTMPPDDFVLVCDGPLTPELDSVIEAKHIEMGQVLQVIRMPQNGGLGHALNEGLKHCKNELVARMDSDDISAEERCEKQLRLFAQNPMWIFPAVHCWNSLCHRQNQSVNGKCRLRTTKFASFLKSAALSITRA